MDVSKGTHAFPYIHQVWAYDALDLLAVKEGQKQPWEVRPYATWRLTEMDSTGSARISGAAYDIGSGRLYITEAYGEEPAVHVYQITVPGAIPGPVLRMNPGSKDFGLVNIDSAFPQVLTISSQGTEDLIISSIELTGTDAGMFRLERKGRNACTSSTPAIPSGGSCTIRVKFTPLSEGAKSAILRIGSNDPAGPTDVTLNGEGTLDPVFGDCSESYWAEDFINTLFYSGITGGCGGGDYCPDNPVTRQEMAVFIISAMGETPSTAATDASFDDVTEPYASFINRMHGLGIAAGCGPRAYCPNDPLTRAQMAVFLIMAMGETGSTMPYNAYFDDITDDQFAGFINRLNELGITGGCETRIFCPDRNTNRAMMAIFLAASF